MKCTLKRCKGKRGCICPTGSVPIGTYAGRKIDSPKTAESNEKLPSLPQSPSKASPCKSNIVTNNKNINKKSTLSTGVAGKNSGKLPKIIKQVEDSNSTGNTSTAVSTDNSFMNGVDGEVTIRYNHYKKKFPIIRGSTTSEVIDAEYYLSFAFPKSKIHITLYGPSDFSFEDQGLSSRPILMERPEGTYWGLDPEKEYWVDIEEDSEERRAYEERQDALAKENAMKRAEDEKYNSESNSIVKSKTESCSCIEGNPCLDRYACKDWEHRYEVAKRYGWKGFQ